MAFDLSSASSGGFDLASAADEDERKRRRAELEAKQAAEDAAIRRQGGLSDQGGLTNLFTGIGKGMSDMYLGGRQLLNAVTPGDNPEWAAEAKDREQRDKALMNTGGGMVGKYGTDIAASFLPMGLAAKAIQGGGRLAGMSRAALAGGAQNMLTPDEQYDPLKQAGQGAAFGVGGDVLGRVLGRAYAPFRNSGAGTTARENAALLNREGLPSQIPSTQTDNSMVQAGTNALEQIPYVGKWVRNARNKNAEWLTEQATAGTGKAVKELPLSAREEMFTRLNNEGDAFRTGQQVPMSKVSAEAQAAADRVRQYAEATAQGGKEAKLSRIADALADTPATPIRPLPPGIPPPPPGIGAPGMTAPSAPQTRTLDEVMNLRNAAGKLAHEETDPVLRSQYRAYRESLADELRAVHGSDRFNTWLKNWGAMEDVQNAAGKAAGELRAGKLTGERLAMGMESSFKPGTRLEKIISAYKENAPSPPSGWNRSMYQSLLMGGAPIAAGGYGDWTRGEFGAGTALGTGVSASLIAGLSRKAPSQASIDAIIKALTAAGIGTGMQF